MLTSRNDPFIFPAELTANPLSRPSALRGSLLACFTSALSIAALIPKHLQCISNQLILCSLSYTTTCYTLEMYCCYCCCFFPPRSDSLEALIKYRIEAAPSTPSFCVSSDSEYSWKKSFPIHLCINIDIQSINA